MADLKAENAYLKKLHALVQSKKEKEEKRNHSGIMARACIRKLLTKEFWDGTEHLLLSFKSL